MLCTEDRGRTAAASDYPALITIDTGECFTPVLHKLTGAGEVSMFCRFIGKSNYADSTTLLR